jgi:hypothetical protein
MNIEELAAFLHAQETQLAAFLDFEPLTADPTTSARLLDAWFASSAWRGADYQIVELGKDGAGSRFAAWLRPVEAVPAPVVYLGSEGAHGVLTLDSAAFAQALAHNPVISTRAGMATLEAGPTLHNADEKQALAAYRRAVKARLGPLPPLATCTTVPAAIQQALIKWIAEWSLHP